MNEMMSPDEFRSIGELLWGVQWKVEIARALKKSRATIYRYCSGKAPICGLLSIVLRSWAEKFQQTGEVPK